jgi:hypothetical protein
MAVLLVFLPIRPTKNESFALKMAPEQQKITLEQEEIVSEREKIESEHEKIESEHEKIESEHEKIGSEHEKIQLDRSRVAVESSLTVGQSPEHRLWGFKPGDLIEGFIRKGKRKICLAGEARR